MFKTVSAKPCLSHAYRYRLFCRRCFGGAKYSNGCLKFTFEAAIAGFRGLLSPFCADASVGFLLVVRGVKGVEILAVQVVLRDAQGIAEALIMHKLALAQILDGIAHVGIVHHTKDIVIGHARLLLC